MKVHEALAQVMTAVQAVGKSERNTAQNFSFRGIDAVLNAVGPAFRKVGVVVMPEVIDTTYETVEVGQKRTQMGHAVLKVRYTFYGPEGDSIACVVAAESMDSGDKAVAKAMSVAFRTALLQALALPTDEPDPDHDSYERAPARSHEDLLAEVTKMLGEVPDDLLDKTKAWDYASSGVTEAQATIRRLTELRAV